MLGIFRSAHTKLEYNRVLFLLSRAQLERRFSCRPLICYHAHGDKCVWCFGACRSSVLGVPASASADSSGGFPSMLLGVINPIFLRTLSR